MSKQFVPVNPLQRFGEVYEVAARAAFLLSGKAQFINGALITCVTPAVLRFGDVDAEL